MEAVPTSATAQPDCAPPPSAPGAAVTFPSLTTQRTPKRKCDRKNEPPAWYKSNQAHSQDLLERMATAAERKNELLEEKTSLLKEILKKLG